MASRRQAARILGQVSLFASGVGIVIAWQAGFYASATLLALVGFWLAAVAAWPEPSAALEARSAEAPDDDSVRAEQRLLGSLLDQTPAPLLVLHPDGVVRAGNRAARALFRTDDRLVSPPPALVDVLRDDPSGGRLTVDLDTDTGPRTYAVSMTDLVGPSGALRLAALLDIQPEIRAAEAAALRDLLQVLGHEIMNALTPIASLAATASDLLCDETPSPTALARDAVATLARRAEGLTRFVEAYRTLARLPPPNLKPTSLNALLEETARVFDSRWRALGVILKVTLLDPDVTVRLDLDLMVHALMNILSNGAEAALTSPGAAPWVTLTAEAFEAGVNLKMEDSGPGIAPADRDRVFQPFFTTKGTGTGVGLSFARQVALSHGGELTLSPQLARTGATFLLTL